MNLLKENANIFLPVLGLLAVIIATAFVDFGPEGDIATVMNGVEKESYEEKPEMQLEDGYDYKAQINTNYGEFTINLFEGVAPQNVNNLVFLAEEGFYDDLQFYRVIHNFIVQAGHPNDGGAQYTIEDEISSIVRFDDYSVAMTNDGESDTNRADFFVTLLGSDAEHLDGDYTIVGEVVQGHNVVDNIGQVDVEDNFAPVEEVVIEEVVIKMEE